MVKKPIPIFAMILSLSVILTACGTASSQKDLLKVGHGGGLLSAALYAADYDADIQQFRSSSDVAYALLLGALDIGFVEADRLPALAELDGFDRLTVMGKVTYPYGATLILREGLNVRLQELDGLTIAVSAPMCELFEAFKDDAERLGADLSGVTYNYMAFDAMLPALEAGTADAAIIKGSYSVVALHEGNTILYQNWDVEPGDECCPAIVDQTILVLLARREASEAAIPFVDALIAAQTLSPDELRRAAADSTMIPLKLLQSQPVPEFSPADDELTKTLIEHDHDEEEDDHNG